MFSAQELALSAAIALSEYSGRHSITCLACGTDGTDGPTDATGAVVDCNTVALGLAAGLDAAQYLATNDSYTFFQKLGGDAHVITGATGTNVMDIVVLLIGPPDAAVTADGK